MIQLNEETRGRPASRPIIATCKTVAMAASVVKELRSISITATWQSNWPYRIRVDASDRKAAVAHLRSVHRIPNVHHKPEVPA